MNERSNVADLCGQQAQLIVSDIEDCEPRELAYIGGKRRYVVVRYEERRQMLHFEEVAAEIADEAVDLDRIPLRFTAGGDLVLVENSMRSHVLLHRLLLLLRLLMRARRRPCCRGDGGGCVPVCLCVISKRQPGASRIRPLRWKQ